VPNDPIDDSDRSISMCRSAGIATLGDDGWCYGAQVVPVAENLQSVRAHVFLTPRRGAPAENLGLIVVTPKPERTSRVRFSYKGRLVTGTVSLIDPHDWEKRPGAIPQVFIHLD